MSDRPFVIDPHFRLQEWVAEEKGYFADEGLNYVFREQVQATDGKVHDQGMKVGAYQIARAGARDERELRVSLDRERRGVLGARSPLSARLLRRTVGRVR